MKRYRLFLAFYLFVLVWFVVSSTKAMTRRDPVHSPLGNRNLISREKEYWFSVSFGGRFWMVNKNARIFDLHSPEDFSFPVVVTNAKIDPEKGIIEGVKSILPERIPDFIYEINFEEKYLTLDNSAIIKLLSLNELRECIRTLEITHQYLNPRVIYFFSNGRIYRIS